MKVLMTCDAVGGVWQYANDLARALTDEGVDVVLAVLGPAGDSVHGRHPREGGDPSSTSGTRNDGGNEPSGRSWVPAFAGMTVVETNLPLDWLASGPEEVLATGRAIAALAVEHRVDLIHLNSPALAAAGPFPTPVIAVAHGCPGTWFAAQGLGVPAGLAWHEGSTRRGFHAADAVVAPSAAYAETVRRHYALAVAPSVVHNGRVPADVAGSPDADHVLTAGRLWDRVKNTPLLDAVAALIPVPFRAAGPVTAPHGETVAIGHLHLLGTLDAAALAAEYARAPIFVSAARFEPFGLAVLEAAQAGCPLVLSGIDTFRELWTGAALFVSDDDPAAYAAAIDRIRTEPDLRAHLSEVARQRAARYTPAAMAADMLAIYGGLLAAPERVAA